MVSSTPKPARVSRQHPLAVCVAALVSITTPPIALCVAVTNCNDVGPNSLRAAVTNTLTGGTIDMTSLMCSTITLEDSQIVISQQDLTLLGPARRVTIAHDGNYDRVLNHQGVGTLKLENVNVTQGNPYSSSHYVYGGCIFSAGSVYLKSSSVTYCVADTSTALAAGGGVFTAGDLTLINATIAGNVAGSSLSTEGEGGGAHVGGNLAAVSSSIRNNSTKGSYNSFHGGVGVYKSFSISGSTISGNSANVIGGLAAVQSYGPGILDNSTISGNHASSRVGGAYLSVPTTVRNSTIAFNTAVIGKVQSFYQSPGLAIGTNSATVTIDLESSIISNNTYVINGTTIENDFGQQPIGSGTITVTGHHNLIPASLTTFAPNVVTVSSCPLLGPLRDNGGPTQTHALLTHSLAIDEGSNPILQEYDQRGAPYKRSDGVFANFTDIGAYEVQQEDVVFNAGFDGCP